MRLAVLSLALLFLAACGPGLQSGVVTSKRLDAAHVEHYVDPVYFGQTCMRSGKSTICTPRYIYVPRTRDVPDQFYLGVEGNCRQDNGERKCDREWKSVTRDYYGSAKVGDWFGPTPEASANGH